MPKLKTYQFMVQVRLQDEDEDSAQEQADRLIQGLVDSGDYPVTIYTKTQVRVVE